MFESLSPLIPFAAGGVIMLMIGIILLARHKSSSPASSGEQEIDDTVIVPRKKRPTAMPLVDDQTPLISRAELIDRLTNLQSGQEQIDSRE